MTSGNHWQRLEQLFNGALEKPPDARDDYLDRECGSDTALRREVAAMLSVAPEPPLDLERRLVADYRASAPEPTDDPFVGRRIGAWRVVRRIGRGGMAVVFQVEREEGAFRQVAALKIGRPAFGDSESDRFRVERQILANLTHPNIARLLDGGVTPEGQPYLVMEYVEGEPLTAYCAARVLPLEARLRLFQVVCRAVQHAHQNLVVHRDLKPANILVSRDGDVKLLDFGIAKLLDASSIGVTVATTREHVRPMTLEYAAPEQISGGPITTATDVHALGVILYELVSGVRPYDAPTTDTLEQRITNDEPRPPSQAATAPGIDRDLDTIVLMALRKEPERRYGSAGQLAEDVERLLDGRPVLAQRDTVRYRARKFVQRHRIGVAAAALVLIVLTAAAVVNAVQARRLAVERDAANDARRQAEQVLSALTEIFRVTDPSVTPANAAQSMAELLKRGEDLVQRQFENQPDARVRLAHALGRIHTARSEYPRARTLFEDALATQRAVAGDGDPLAVEIAHDLAVLVGHMGEGARAEAMLRVSLDEHRRLYGARHDRVAQALQDLAAVARDNTEQESRFREALEMRRALHIGDHAETAWAMSQLASQMVSMGRASEALPLARDAVAMLQRTVGERHPRHLQALGELTQALNQNNLLDEAEQAQRRLIGIQRDVFGPQSFQVAESLNSIGVNLVTRGRPAEAEEALAEAFQAHAAVFGEGHWRTANVARNLGRALEMQQRYADAETWLTRAADLYARADGRVTHNTHYIRAQAALVKLRQGRAAEAERDLRAALRGVEAEQATAGANRVADLQLWLGRVLVESGQPAAAEPLIRQALSYREGALGAVHPRAAEARCELVRALSGQRRHPEAREPLGRCWPIYEKWGLADPVVLSDLRRLADDQPPP